MSIVDLHARVVIDAPVLELASLSTNKDVRRVELEQSRRLGAQIVRLQVSLASRLQIERADVDEGLAVVREAQYDVEAGHGQRLRLELNHGVLRTRDTSTLVLLGRLDDFRHLLDDRISVLIDFFLFLLAVFLVFIVLVFVFFFSWRLLGHNGALAMRVLHLGALLLRLVHVFLEQDLVGLGRRRVNADVAVGASHREIFSSLLRNGADLDDRVVVRVLLDAVLLHLVKAEHEEATLAL